MAKPPKGFGKARRGVGRSGGTRSVAGKGIGVVVLAAVVIGAVVPGLRHKILNAVHPTYSAVALAKPIPSDLAKCHDPGLANSAPHLSADNTTLYWITQPVSVAPQVITVSFATTSSIARVRVSSNVQATPATTSGAIPHPLQLQFLAGSTVLNPVTLSDPPKDVQAFALDIPQPTVVRITLLTTDPGAAAGSCTETAFTFDHKS